MSLSPFWGVAVIPRTADIPPPLGAWQDIIAARVIFTLMNH
jgi:hypothetical protein